MQYVRLEWLLTLYGVGYPRSIECVRVILHSPLAFPRGQSLFVLLCLTGLADNKHAI